MSKQGILVVVSGFSGAGKGTIMKALMKKYGEDYALSISATTRKPRPGEVHGESYFFINKDEFEYIYSTIEDLEMFINEGCDRIGTSSAVNMLKGEEVTGY